LAPGLNPDNRLGDLRFDVSSGLISSTGGPQTITTTVACPEGYRDGSRVFFIWPDGTWSTDRSPAPTHSAPQAGSGLDGDPVNRTGSWASGHWGTLTFPLAQFAGHDGVASYVVTCDKKGTTGLLPTIAAGVSDSKYFSADLTIAYGDGTNPTWVLVGQDGAQADITMDVPVEESAPPATPAGLTISAKPGPVTVTGPAARPYGRDWIATGSLGNVTVNDDRRDSNAPAWALNGRASAFTAPGIDEPISSENLGWTPALVSGPGTAGPVVTAAAVGGLSVDQTLATGAASDNENLTTTVTAELFMTVPSGTPTGSYTATLTLTLI
jgi:hypothetical protein